MIPIVSPALILILTFSKAKLFSSLKYEKLTFLNSIEPLSITSSEFSGSLISISSSLPPIPLLYNFHNLQNKLAVCESHL